MNRSLKRQIGIFVTSFIITACIIVLVGAFLTVQNNTGATMGASAKAPLYLSAQTDSLTLTAFGKEFEILDNGVTDFIKSKTGSVLLSLWLLL